MGVTGNSRELASCTALIDRTDISLDLSRFATIPDRYSERLNISMMVRLTLPEPSTWWPRYSDNMKMTYSSIMVSLSVSSTVLTPSPSGRCMKSAFMNRYPAFSITQERLNIYLSSCTLCPMCICNIRVLCVSSVSGL